MAALGVLGMRRAALAAALALGLGGAACAGGLTAGVNLSGGEFNPRGDRRGVDYDYPTAADVERLAGNGFRLVRLPFLARRLLGPPGPRPAHMMSDIATISDLIDVAAALGMAVVLDMHDYGFSKDGELIGATPRSVETYAASWGAIAAAFKDRRNVFFGLMNEPHFQTATTWAAAANAAIAAIRASGARQGVLVPGTDWSVASRWMRSGNAEAMRAIVDPLNNFVFEAHQYLDPDETGTNPVVRPGWGAKSLMEFTAWARANGKRAFLGEFAFAANVDAFREGEAMLSYMEANADVWSGWAWWGGGPYWGAYMFAIGSGEPDRPQMQVLRRHLARDMVADRPQ